MRNGAARSATALALAACAALSGAVPAHGTARSEGYRYWSFWERDGDDWTYATRGPATAQPADGDVQGFRFSVSADSGDAARPRTAPAFDAVCGDTPEKDGTNRVALVLDFGTAGDAPSGETPPEPRTECARVPDGASTGEALAAVAEPLRYNTSALLCAIAGYPRSGCGEQVSGERPEASAGGDRSGERSPEDTGADADGSPGPSVGLYAGIAAVVLLGGAGVWQARRRR
ncbi:MULTISPECIES: SCO2322 family protein [Streptomyces]|uniref:Secreted protein n=1 Tax=Streptomyces lycii TaxID=2654337 RepID=A0ABQ7FR14_9ACTN|nr:MULTISPECIES: SCO2322 family protein [Streptomyces]KAF4410256.1 hypothetical protein GCU69_04805 [Streptomyces lycii]PGH50606.1 hypothetical protein CRI70_11180 [Streptomyces sp. Ru87]